MLSWPAGAQLPGTSTFKVNELDLESAPKLEGGWINGDKGEARVCGLNGCDMIGKNGEMVTMMSPNKFRRGARQYQQYRGSMK